MGSSQAVDYHRLAFFEDVLDEAVHSRKAIHHVPLIGVRLARETTDSKSQIVVVILLLKETLSAHAFAVHDVVDLVVLKESSFFHNRLVSYPKLSARRVLVNAVCMVVVLNLSRFGHS